MPFQITRADLVQMRTDAIVNAANSGLREGGGVCGAIFAAAGETELRAACEAIGHCDVGGAVITPGFRLAARYVIHVVGPVWRGGAHGEERLLAAAYRSALLLATAQGLCSIAIPLISSGVYGYPRDQAFRVAVRTIGAFLLEHAELTVYLVIYADEPCPLPAATDEAIVRYLDGHLIPESQQPAGRISAAPSCLRRLSGAPAAPTENSAPMEAPAAKPIAAPFPDDSRESLPAFLRERPVSGAEPANPPQPSVREEGLDHAPLSRLTPQRAESQGNISETQGFYPGVASRGAPSPFDGITDARNRPDLGVAPSAPSNAGEPTAPPERNRRGTVRDFTAEPGAEGTPSFAAPERNLADAVAHLSDPFSVAVLHLIDRSGRTDVEIYKRANLDRKLFSKLRSEPVYRPSKRTAIALCVALRLNLDDTRDLLGRAGYALSPCSKADMIVAYFIEHGNYDIFEINEALFAFDQPCLGA